MSQRSSQRLAHNPGASMRPAGVEPPGWGKSVGKGGSVMIGLDELERIKMTVQKTFQDPYLSMRNDERQNLQNVSKNKIQKWPNTLEALRHKREEDRIKQLETEEIGRREVDAKEQDYQDELRRQQIERANRHLHDQQDMVKSLKSKLLHSDVLHEREAQKALKARKEQVGKEIDQNWRDLEKQKLEEYDIKMRQKLEKEYEKRQTNAQAISDQLEEFKLNYIQGLKEEMLEGELIKRQVEEDIEREKIRELQRQKKMHQMKEDIIKANKDQMRLQQLMKEKDLDDERRIEHFTRDKEALDQEKADREEKKVKDKLSKRQAMIDRQVESLRGLRDNEEQVLNKQVAEAEDKANRLFEDQQRRKYEMKQAVERSRALQIDRKNQQKASEKKEEQDFSEFWRVRNEELQMAESQEKDEERQRAKELVAFLAKQSDHKLDNAKKEFRNNNEASLQAQALLDQQEKNFYSYAERCIGEWQSQGKNVKPLILELKNYRKRIV